MFYLFVCFFDKKVKSQQQQQQQQNHPRIPRGDFARASGITLGYPRLQQNNKTNLFFNPCNSRELNPGPLAPHSGALPLGHRVN